MSKIMIFAKLGRYFGFFHVFWVSEEPKTSKKPKNLSNIPKYHKVTKYLKKSCQAIKTRQKNPKNDFWGFFFFVRFWIGFWCPKKWHYGVYQNLKNLIFEFWPTIEVKIDGKHDRTKKKWFGAAKVSKNIFFWGPLSHFFVILAKIRDFHIYTENRCVFVWVGGCQNFRNLKKTEKSS